MRTRCRPSTSISAAKGSLAGHWPAADEGFVMGHDWRLFYEKSTQQQTQFMRIVRRLPA